MAPQQYQLRVTDRAAVLLRTLHPHIKKKLKAALQAIAADPFAGKELGDELSGLRSFRVGRFRIIYRLTQKRRVEIIVVGPRERIYQETYRLIRKQEP